MRTIRLGVVPKIHNEETSTMWCRLIDCSCNGKDTQLRGLYLLEGHACCSVWHAFCVCSRFHVVSVAQTKSLDKLRQIFEANNDCGFWLIFYGNDLFCLLPYAGSWITHLGCGHTQSDHIKQYQLHLAHRIAVNASQNDPIHATTNNRLASRFAGMDVTERIYDHSPASSADANTLCNTCCI
jgi:hypothetical protein